MHEDDAVKAVAAAVLNSGESPAPLWCIAKKDASGMWSVVGVFNWWWMAQTAFQMLELSLSAKHAGHGIPRSVREGWALFSFADERCFFLGDEE